MGHHQSIKRRDPYFEGWYFKHQSRSGKALALIPAYHVDGAGRSSASLQIIAEGGSWWLEYPEPQFQMGQNPFWVQIGGSRFGEQGMQADICQEGISLQGWLRYGPFMRIRSDIMGPFRFMAGMQCAHGVVSMGHRLEGRLNLNGEVLDFTDGVGYIETDRGRSFPDVYLWTQCHWPEGGGLMLAVASIPLPVGSFTGCISAIFHHGREYCLATYRGARIEGWSASGAVIRQGGYRLSVELLEERRQPLCAPVDGGMERFIHESLCATVRYCFWKGERVLFQHTDRLASFEYSDRRSSGLC